MREGWRGHRASFVSCVLWFFWYVHKRLYYVRRRARAANTFVRFTKCSRVGLVPLCVCMVGKKDRFPLHISLHSFRRGTLLKFIRGIHMYKVGAYRMLSHANCIGGGVILKLVMFYYKKYRVSLIENRQFMSRSVQSKNIIVN